MESLFLLEDGARATFLQHIVQSFHCTYICLWTYDSYLLQSNYLISMDGFYNEQESNQPSSSSGRSLARRLFDEYRQPGFVLQKEYDETNRVPGHAFKNGVPYMELKELDLLRLASVEAQLHFYQEARIKTAIFMGCMTGEIELGMSNDTQVNMEMEMRNMFPDNFSRRELPHPLTADQNLPSSSSSSMRSLSVGSPEPSPFLFNIASTSYLPELPHEAPIEQALRPITTSISPLHEATQPYSQIQNLRFPTQETKDDVMAQAFLAVLSSQDPSSSTSLQSSQNTPPNYPLSQRVGAFKTYRSALAPSAPLTARARRQNLLKRSITFFRSLSLMRAQARVHGSRPSSTQLHHMISERKRREKLNESFQALRSLLPPGTKKDKASVLASTTEHLTSLKGQVEELTKRSQDLEAKLLATTRAAPREEVISLPPTNERVNVQVTNVAESTSEARMVDVRVIVRGDHYNMFELVIRIMEFLKDVKNVSLTSVEADAQEVESNSLYRVVLRLKTEGGEWDESAFQEAVRRVVADLAQ